MTLFPRPGPLVINTYSQSLVYFLLHQEYELIFHLKLYPKGNGK